MEIFQVDAFTNQPFHGNPAGVCVLPSPAGEDWMRRVAAEMNLSETAFLHPEKEGYRLRWFTPSIEITLCGHATLASAHVLWRTGKLPLNKEAHFHTLSGLLKAKLQGDWIELDFPERTAKPCAKPERMEESLGARVLSLGHNGTQYLVELDSEKTVRDLRPDFDLMNSYLDEKLHGVIVTSRSTDPSYDFVSRFFAPAAGINEDPVTGSAHCCLGPYWRAKLKKDSFFARQISARGGVIKVRCEKDRVFLGGQAVTVLSGEILDPPK